MSQLRKNKGDKSVSVPKSISRGAEIKVVGAKEHNLKNINLTLPRDQLTVITGISGSGKTSLVFDTIYAEGRRRYVESLSAYARQFLQGSAKPDVERIEGLSPAIAIEQKTSSRNPRSTVGTVTEIYDYLRLLYARAGIAYSPATGKPIERQTISEMVDKVKALPPKSRLLLMAPVVRARKGEYRKEFADWLKKGFQRVRVDGETYDLESPPTLEKNFRHDISVIVDRIIPGQTSAERLAESFETALRLANGLAEVEEADEKEDKIRVIFSENFACPVSGFTIEEIEPRLFSFNSPHGACPECSGLGVQAFADPALVVPNPKLSLEEGAISPWSRSGITSPYYRLTLEAIAKHYGFSMRAPWKTLPKKIRDIVLYGSGTEKILFSYKSEKMQFQNQRPFAGVLKILDRRFRESANSPHTQELIATYQTQADCGECDGARLRPQALAVKLHNKHVGELGAFSVAEALDWFTALPSHLNQRQKTIAVQVLREIRERLRFLCDVGLNYLTLGRSAHTLSGGESQRIRLASQVGSGLTGVIYALDEPSIGLHPRDNARLLNSLGRLRDLGNTVLVVEHDEEAMLTADHLVDVGPGAGRHGGEIVAEGVPKSVMQNAASLTGQYLCGKKQVPLYPVRAANKKWLSLTGASGHNLKKVDAKIPLGLFTCITGVSGSGKSSLLFDTIYRAMRRHFTGAGDVPLPFKKISGLEHLDKVIEIDQSPIGRTPRSNPATYTGAFAPIREWFTNLPLARERGYKPGRFSFNVKGGRCEACQGDGLVKIEMHFLPDVYVQCDVCDGKRYNRETLQVVYRGQSIADVLDMSCERAAEFFAAVPPIFHHLDLLNRVGLGYIRVGQAATTLSGGEAQRIKLAKELSRRATGRTLYILDEPTTGLHFHDVAKLLEILHALVDAGNSVLVIEHNMEIIKTADWVIDLGPEGGNGGGEIIAAGKVEDIAACKASYTAPFLREALARHKKTPAPSDKIAKLKPKAKAKPKARAKRKAS